MKPHFEPDVTPKEMLDVWISTISSEIDELTNDYNRFYNGNLFPYFQDIKFSFNNFIEAIDKTKNLPIISDNFLIINLEPIHDDLVKIHRNIATVAPESSFLDTLNNIANRINALYIQFLDNIKLGIPNILSQNEFQFLNDGIVRKGINIEAHITFDEYNKAKLNQKSDINKILTDIWNLATPQLLESNSSEILRKLSELDTIVELINLKENIDEIKDSSETLKQIKQNASTENNKNLNNGYAEEALILKERIDKLELYIVGLFTTIIFAVAFKIVFLLFDLDNFKNIYNFLTFISLILACSALIAYFVKDRNRLIKLHDHYKMNVLELSTMPEYMRELDKGQRQQLIIDLSSNYFKGANHNQECSNDKTSEIESLKSTISDIAKMVSDIKETVKKP
ncbi:hypothetical protein [Acinetobacter baumannii]|uniref:hypothetical protein n=1 Tax=Acinetobacter baumannii TaxID=470 RepID=UPI00387DD31F